MSDIMDDTSHESWCTDCGNTQGTNHLGSQACNVCGKSNWLDAVREQIQYLRKDVESC